MDDEKPLNNNYNVLYDNEDTTTTKLITEKTPKITKFVTKIKTEPIKPLLSTLDIVIATTLVAPCVIGFWRGTWQLMDTYAHYFPTWESFLLSIGIHVFFNMVQDFLADIFTKKTASKARKMLDFFVIRVYTYIFAGVCIMNWRAGWLILDQYLGITVVHEHAKREGIEPLLVVTPVCLLCIVGLKGVINCLSLPMVICMDWKKDIFFFPTRFKRRMGEKFSLYILDCLFSVLIIGTLVVFVWRGAWAIFDILIFPENDVWSSWTSLILGYTGVLLAFLLQPFMKWLCDRLTGTSRLLVADLFLIFSLIGTINVWRGIWNLLNIYLLPDNMELSCWITHWVCLIILILLGCSNSLLVRGVYIDAEEPAGKCVVFPCYYLRIIYQEQKMKKIEKTEKSKIEAIENNHVVNVQTLEMNHKENDVEV